VAKEAERLLRGTGWLPESFRTPASSSVGLKIDFDMALLVLASALYRIMPAVCAAMTMLKRAKSSAT
jgi:hypothetical protein